MLSALVPFREEGSRCCSLSGRARRVFSWLGQAVLDRRGPGGTVAALSCSPGEVAFSCVSPCVRQVWAVLQQKQW